jgi:cytochrome c oxidase accessory protein FixG
LNLPVKPAPAAASASADVAVEVVSLYRAEKHIYARGVDGRFARWRWALVWLTQLVFYGLPWLNWPLVDGARQAVLFDLGARRFYIFHLVLYPQDFIFLTGLLVLSAFALFLFTAVAGRLWCGYACPQTVYTEIFMWVERRFEGDRSARMRLDRSPMSLDKLWRKGGKHLVWVAIGLWTGFTFVGYFTPIQELWSHTLSFALGPWEAFWVLFYGFATWGNAGFMREQVCKYMCPYARFQGAMFDRDTMIVTYDAGRGEPRGARSKGLAHMDLRSAGKGDCIDCGLCVQVCPTGIDIRQGQQHECIGCAACIDACDDVMSRVAYPKGLIRYATENGVEKGWSPQQMLRRVLRPRVLIYAGVMSVVLAVFVTALWMRPAFRVDVVRDRGAIARQVAGGALENSYRLQVMNNVEASQSYRISVEAITEPGAKPLTLRVAGATQTQVDAAQSRWVPVAVQVDALSGLDLRPGAMPIRFVIERLGEHPARVEERSTFVVPR